MPVHVYNKPLSLTGTCPYDPFHSIQVQVVLVAVKHLLQIFMPTRSQRKWVKVACKDTGVPILAIVSMLKLEISLKLLMC